MSEREIQTLLEQLREVARQEAQNVIKQCVQVAPGVIISISGETATVHLLIDDTPFTAPIVTKQTLKAGDPVNIAFWGNLSTAIVLSA